MCPGKIIGVTGTKGKGTTATLIYEILKAAGKKVFFGGNIGKGIFEHLDEMDKDSLVVLELSSFQLIDLHKSPHVAVMLMMTSEHQDWHKSPDEYVEAKSKITQFQMPNDFVVYNQDYPNSVKIGMQGKGQKIAVSGNDWKGEMRLRGGHNRENVAAAAAVAKIFGIQYSVFGEVIKNFKGLEHRLEEAATVDGVTYFDDSFSTTPETTIAAIKAFTEPLILIAGGSEKGSDFTELGKVISEAKNIKAVILIGLMAERIKEKISNEEIKILRGAKNMAEILEQVKSVAESGDVVVLSPAAASFDMFANYKDRGDQFKEAVRKLGA
ncbi:MAG: UDP-N-acetylmuramoylalanine-D-glutamate ligase [Candidatus Amesbacteria bacterium GW2011_GWB1_47_26]|nr:MAG: UDP-N-acetylmuramoylalanine-D-glutamate ligase [Candidatus Amesbacteria bacterium GW2011_GWB1_47_26]